ncbi:MAG: GspE/PulE family protein [Planctomycetota bacterium]|nr:GspE/PulE family protein [Planctomycetota bacterium]
MTQSAPLNSGSVFGDGPGGRGPGLLYESGSFARVLLGSGEVSEGQWRTAQEIARRQGTSELHALLDLGLVSEAVLAERLSAWSGLPRWKPGEERGALSASAPLEFMRASGVLVLEDAASDVGDAPAEAVAPRLVVTDLSDRFLMQSLLSRYGADVPAMIGSLREVRAFLEELDAGPESDAGEEGHEQIDVSGELSALRDMASEAPVVRFCNQMVERAMHLGASDIHLERFDKRVSLRFRVDGILIDQPAPPLRLYEAILCRIKIMANLDIAERRRAQDGRVPMRLRGRMVDMRISIVPTMYGQDSAIRLQDRQKLADIDLNDLGFRPRDVKFLVSASEKSHGILLITGPTGSGKTTTLYALLRRVYTPELKFVTVEDPVEYAMDGVNQIQVNPAINLTFGNTLRHVLRHDPDVILIGEIRDRETAEIAFQASLTGHMVLSTLHTNNVPGTFVRLVDMGVEPYLVNAAVEGVSAQRLMRRICTACGNEPGGREACKNCGGIGYRGRIAVMEFSGLSRDVKRCILDGAEEHRIRGALLESGYIPLRRVAEELVAAGVTDEAEVVRALGAAAEEVEP